ncbi:AIR synthase related protein [Sodalis-like endosymbiont of Proechinophthirus fluctus]|uniref:AIR synthase related protein n=1 Tax=Sodalis-like endosymbiont of Proechinophthirus fluctus TaxID=1462730 RepID=UPI000B0642E6
MDTLVVGTYFLPDISPSDSGYKSLMVNLRDLAAMGTGSGLAVAGASLAIGGSEGWLPAFSDSLFQKLDYYEYTTDCWRHYPWSVEPSDDRSGL